MILLWQLFWSFLYSWKCEALRKVADITVYQGDTSIYDKSQVDTVDVITTIGPQRCMRECILHSDCRSLVYSRQELTCVLRQTSTGLMNHTQDFQLRLSPHNLGACQNQDCGEWTKCVSLSSGNYACISLGHKDGSIRLSGGSHPGEGRLEILHQGVWGRIYGDNVWYPQNAMVVCRQIGGYSYGVSVNIYGDNLMGGQGSGPYWLKDVTCNGDEENLLACPDLNWGPHSDYYRVAAVICSNTAFDGNRAPLRLSGGNSASSGVLEIFYAGHWGNIGYTTSYFVQEDLNVACRQLNYSGGYIVDATFYPDYKREMIWISKPQCSGDEDYISDCDIYFEWGTATTQPKDVAILCADNDSKKNDTVRLVNGDTPYRGRLEIERLGMWGTIMNMGWDDNDASVVCRQLGYNNGFAVADYYGTGDELMVIWGRDVDCNGTEQYLEDCAGDWTLNTKGYQHLYDVGVICSLEELNTTMEGELRIVDGTPTIGRLEIYIHGIWGGICVKKWKYSAASVACRQMGFTGGMTITIVSVGPGEALVQDFRCIGDEARLLDCTKTYFSTTSCSFRDHAGVMCWDDTTNSTNDGALRLQGGQNSSEGWLEVYHFGVWGTVYDYVTQWWKGNNPLVICRQLGFTSGRALFNNFFGQDDGPVWMSDVRCVGNESMLVECPFGGWGVQELFPTAALSRDLRHGIGIICSDLEHYSEADDMYGDIRLASGSSEKSGRVEVYGPTGYGTIRKDAISSESYEVICNQLGWSTPQIEDSFGPGTGMVWLFVVKCNGDEERLEYCESSGWGLYARTNHAKDTGVTCV